MLKNQICQTDWTRICYNNIRLPKPGPLIGFSPCVTLWGIRTFISMKSLEVLAKGVVIISNVTHHHARRKRKTWQTAHGLWKLLSGSGLCPLKFHWTKQDIWPWKRVGSIIILSCARKGEGAEFWVSRTNDCLSNVFSFSLPTWHETCPMSLTSESLRIYSCKTFPLKNATFSLWRYEFFSRQAGLFSEHFNLINTGDQLLHIFNWAFLWLVATIVFNVFALLLTSVS